MFPILNCIVWVVVGVIAGTVAGRLLRGKGYGPIGDLVLGLIGSVVGGMAFSLLNIDLGCWVCGDVVVAVFGAVLFVALTRFFLDKNFAH